VADQDARLPIGEDPPPTSDSGDERAILTSYLDLQRAVAIRKIGDLDDEGLRRPMTPSGLTLLGIVKHLAYVERYWFREIVAREDGLTYPWTDEDPDADFRAEPDETARSIAALYMDECARSGTITAERSLDEVAIRGDRQISLRAVLVHMIEETARHLGHADIMREAIDGKTGD
jgi:uncharacterized damage-inducible protein DinB